MSSSFFRKEAIENTTQRLLGDVLLLRPLLFWVYTLAILIIVSVVGVFS
ncbi:hypothetical protein ABW636_06115 [Aquimarina sp. 2201CG1-2-11]